MDNLAKLYEDACILCAGVWFASSSEGAIRLDGEDELRARTGAAGTYGRNKGMLVTAADDGDDHERRRTASASTYTAASTIAGETGTPLAGVGKSKGKSTRHTRQQSTGASSVWTLPLGWTWANRAANPRELYGEPEGEYSWEDLSGSASVADGGGGGEDDEDDGQLRAARREVAIALALLRAFQAHSDRLLARLGDTLAPHLKLDVQRGKKKTKKAGQASVVTLTPKDLLALDLGPLSTMDARFVEWLADAYFGVAQNAHHMKVVVRKARWRDVVGVVFGFS